MSSEVVDTSELHLVAAGKDKITRASITATSKDHPCLELVLPRGGWETLYSSMEAEQVNATFAWRPAVALAPALR
jgi:hypothetical protein